MTELINGGRPSEEDTPLYSRHHKDMTFSLRVLGIHLDSGCYTHNRVRMGYRFLAACGPDPAAHSAYCALMRVDLSEEEVRSRELIHPTGGPKPWTGEDVRGCLPVTDDALWAACASNSLPRPPRPSLVPHVVGLARTHPGAVALLRVWCKSPQALSLPMLRCAELLLLQRRHPPYPWGLHGREMKKVLVLIRERIGVITLQRWWRKALRKMRHIGPFNRNPDMVPTEYSRGGVKLDPIYQDEQRKTIVSGGER